MNDGLPKDLSISIYKVANGFEVHPSGAPKPLHEDRFVFESFAGLAAWLETHFTHRAENVFHDTPNLVGTAAGLAPNQFLADLAERITLPVRNM